jgi:DNA-binding NtrC family response regulator
MEKLNLVVLDDDPDMLAEITDMLDSRFYINAFTNINDCEAFIRFNKNIDVVLTDYNFNSNLNGLDFIEIIRARLDFTVPFILVTGAVINDLERLSKLGCFVIEKPLHTANFVNQVYDIYIKHLESEAASIKNVY